MKKDVNVFLYSTRFVGVGSLGGLGFRARADGPITFFDADGSEESLPVPCDYDDTRDKIPDDPVELLKKAAESALSRDSPFLEILSHCQRRSLGLYIDGRWHHYRTVEAAIASVIGVPVNLGEGDPP